VSVLWGDGTPGWVETSPTRTRSAWRKDVAAIALWWWNDSWYQGHGITAVKATFGLWWAAHPRPSAI
jgi:hypothetical protein